MIVGLSRLDEVRSACGDDDLLMWAAQGLSGGVRVWAAGDAVVAASPGLSRRDRLAVWGGAACATELVRHALREVGPSYRPVGEAGLVGEVTARLAELEAAGTFWWMSLPGPPAPARVSVPGDAAAGWLGPEMDAEVAGLLAVAAPDSYAVPGVPGVRRWAGVRSGGGLAAVAARGRAALMVDEDNPAAIGVYERIGYRRRAFMASRVA